MPQGLEQEPRSAIEKQLEQKIEERLALEPVHWIAMSPS